MKKFLILCAAVGITVAAIAGQVYNRAVVSSDNDGVAQWTNTVDYAAIKLARVWVLDAVVATDVVTVVRITSDNLFTQAVGTITAASGDGSQATLTVGFLDRGDVIKGTGANTTNFTFMVEGEVQKH